MEIRSFVPAQEALLKVFERENIYIYITMMPLIRRRSGFLWLSIALVIALTYVDAYLIPRVSKTPKITYRSAETAITSVSMTNEDIPDPISFREAEVLGLRLMQEGRFDEALVGTSRFLSCLMCRSIKFNLMNEIRSRGIRIMPGVAVLSTWIHLSCCSYF